MYCDYSVFRCNYFLIHLEIAFSYSYSIKFSYLVQVFCNELYDVYSFDISSMQLIIHWFVNEPAINTWKIVYNGKDEGTRTKVGVWNKDLKNMNYVWIRGQTILFCFVNIEWLQFYTFYFISRKIPKSLNYVWCISNCKCIETANNIEYNARGVIVIVVGNEHGDTSSNPGRDWLHFT